VTVIFVGHATAGLICKFPRPERGRQILSVKLYPDEASGRPSSRQRRALLQTLPLIALEIYLPSSRVSPGGQQDGDARLVDCGGFALRRLNGQAQPALGRKLLRGRCC